MGDWVQVGGILEMSIESKAQWLFLIVWVSKT